MVELNRPTCQNDDTIAAVSTAAGPSQRGIVRMSGPHALRLLGALLPSVQGNRIPHDNYRSFAADISLSDIGNLPARVYVMRAPTSYTREDIVEIHTFGSPVVQSALLDVLTRHGARVAGPGEFTRRAFLNGRIDLTQAEAVQELIHARSEAEYRAAASALSGYLSRRTRDIRERLAELAAAVEVSLDFSDHDVEIISCREIVERLRPLHDEVRDLLAGREDGGLPCGRVRAVMFGPPNAGKSSLFNAFLGRRRAIVSPHPGTTRDTIEATTQLNGLELLLVDTAGLRPPCDEVEELAVSRSRDSLRHADLLLCVLDSACPPGPETHESLRAPERDRTMVLLNKCDLGPCHPMLEKVVPPGVETLSVSALDGTGVQNALNRIRARVEDGLVDRGPSELMINARQAGLLQLALEAMERALEGAGGPHSVELVADDIRDALTSLSQLTGESPTEEILDRIFSTFCIGK